MPLAHELPDSRYRAVVGPQGRIVIPAALRKSRGFEEGTVLTFSDEGDYVTMIDTRTALRRFQEYMQSITPPDVDPVTELIAERREEARREAEWMND